MPAWCKCHVYGNACIPESAPSIQHVKAILVLVVADLKFVCIGWPSCGCHMLLVTAGVSIGWVVPLPHWGARAGGTVALCMLFHDRVVYTGNPCHAIMNSSVETESLLHYPPPAELMVNCNLLGWLPTRSHC